MVAVLSSAPAKCSPDDEDYRSISIAPTVPEVMVDAMPYLPDELELPKPSDKTEKPRCEGCGAKLSSKSRFCKTCGRPKPDSESSTDNESLLARYTGAKLDRQFRLLREDVMGPLRDVLSEAKKSAGSNIPSRSIYPHAKVKELVWRPAACVVFEFRLPYGHPGHKQICQNLPLGASPTEWEIAEGITPSNEARWKTRMTEERSRESWLREAEEYWRQSKMLPKDSLVCVAHESNPVLFGTVARREPSEFAKGQFSVGLAIDNSLDFNKAIKLSLDSNSAGILQLLSVCPSYFSYIPVLQRLQQMKDIPMAPELVLGRPPAAVPWFFEPAGNLLSGRGGHSVSSIPAARLGSRLAQQLINPRKQSDSDSDSDSSSEEDKEAPKVPDHSDEALEALCPVPFASLDASQQDAFRFAMKTRMALIQGPPGCGKTFLGVLLVKALLKHTKAKILCICYTNHALDQFLEDLIDQKITEIVRVGGRCKSMKVKPYILGDDEKAVSFSKAASWRHQQIKSEQARLQSTFEALNRRIDSISNSHSWQDVEPFLEDENPSLLSQLRMPRAGSEDGFAQVGSRGQVMGPDYLWNLWHNGDRAPSYLNVKGSLWNLSRKDRWTQIKQWNEKICQPFIDELTQAVKTYQGLEHEINELKDTKYQDALQKVRIIGCTTTGAAKRSNLLQLVKPSIIIVEEAAEIMESSVLTSLSESTKHIIMIGDHKQLRPKNEHYPLSVAYPGNKHNLNLSIFERLVKADFPMRTLTKQHRMHPDISSIARAMTYPKLEDHETAIKREPMRGVTKTCVFVHHDVPEDGENKKFKDENVSKTNAFEVKMVGKTVTYLSRQGYKLNQIVVITPYLGQLLNLQKELASLQLDVCVSSEDLGEMRKAGVDELVGKKGRDTGGIRVATIDNYQGEESDIIVVSLVRSNDKYNIGFLREPERVNVMCTRAKSGMVLIGNIDCLCGALGDGGTIWKQIRGLLIESQSLFKGLPVTCRHGKVELLVTEDDFARRPEGGCTQRCNLKMDCLHLCKRYCHPTDSEHKSLESRCREEIVVRCSRAHLTRLFCYQRAHIPSCDKLVMSECKKGHSITVHCFEVDKSADVCCGVCTELLKLETQLEELKQVNLQKEAAELAEISRKAQLRELETATFKEELDKKERLAAQELKLKLLDLEAAKAKRMAEYKTQNGYNELEASLKVSKALEDEERDIKLLQQDFERLALQNKSQLAKRAKDAIKAEAKNLKNMEKEAKHLKQLQLSVRDEDPLVRARSDATRVEEQLVKARLDAMKAEEAAKTNKLLLQAVVSGNMVDAQRLLQVASIKTLDENGCTLMEVARNNGHSGMENMLAQYQRQADFSKAWNENNFDCLRDILLSAPSNEQMELAKTLAQGNERIAQHIVNQECACSTLELLDPSLQSALNIIAKERDNWISGLKSCERYLTNNPLTKDNPVSYAIAELLVVLCKVGLKEKLKLLEPSEIQDSFLFDIFNFVQMSIADSQKNFKVCAAYAAAFLISPSSQGIPNEWKNWATRLFSKHKQSIKQEHSELSSLSVEANDSNLSKEPLRLLSADRWTKEKESGDFIEISVEEALDKVMSLSGQEKVKDFFMSMYERIKESKKRDWSPRDLARHVRFDGNPGTGKTTVARLYAQMMHGMGLLGNLKLVEEEKKAKQAKKDKKQKQQAINQQRQNKLYEKINLPAPKLASEDEEDTESKSDNKEPDLFHEVGGQELTEDKLKEVLKAIEKAGGGMLFIDEAHQLCPDSKQDEKKKVLNMLITALENLKKTLVVVFAGYAGSRYMDKLFDTDPGLASRVSQTVVFDDFSDEELEHILFSLIKKKDERLRVSDPKFIKIAAQRLGRQRGTPGFGNARSVGNVFDRVVVRLSERVQSLRNTQNEMSEEEEWTLVREDILGPRPKDFATALATVPALAELCELHGIEKIKRELEILYGLVKDNDLLEDQGKPIQSITLNRLFLGNPGTGKTTVAQLYASILNDLGLLSRREIVLKTPSDFIGSALGESERMTNEILDASVGKVLVIDEAYGLHAGYGGIGDNKNPYKEAAVDAIVSKVLNRPGEDRCVLLLGYEKEMLSMIREGNPGLKSRFSEETAFYFEDFNNAALVQIMRGNIEKVGLDIDTSVLVRVAEKLGRGRDLGNFGNARSAANMLSSAQMQKQARQEKQPVPQRSNKLLAEDFGLSEPEKELQNPEYLFDDLIGCRHVKEAVTEMYATVQTAKAERRDPRTVMEMNFAFVGPPGTGKTTVAKRIGSFFVSLGLLSSEDVIVSSAKDFVTGYADQAAKQTEKMFRQALGKVLFIDEAYMLVESLSGKEVLNQIVDLLTRDEFKDKLMLIIAGYKHDIDKLFKINAGLASRISREVKFIDFTVDEAMQVLQRKLKDSEKELSPEAQSVLPTLTQSLCDAPGWSNGRDIETWSKRIYARFAIRRTSNETKQASNFVSPEDLKGALDDLLIRKQEQDTKNSSSPLDQVNIHHRNEFLPSAASAPSVANTPSTSIAKRPKVQAAKQNESGDTSTSEKKIPAEPEGVNHFEALNMTSLKAIQKAGEDMGYETQEQVAKLVSVKESSVDFSKLLAAVQKHCKCSSEEAAGHVKAWKQAMKKVAAEQADLELAMAIAKHTRVAVMQCVACRRWNCQYMPRFHHWEYR